jgi:hypothetical protein
VHTNSVQYFLLYETVTKMAAVRIFVVIFNRFRLNVIGFVTDLPFYVFIPVVCWAPVDLDPREMVTPGSSNR